MKNIFYVLACSAILSMTGCGTEDEDVKIVPGVYHVFITDQRFSCTDGTSDYSPDSVDGYWEIVLTDNNEWRLYLSEDVEDIFVPCVPNGTGLRCVETGQVTIPGICTYPMTMTFDLRYMYQGFTGTSSVEYSLVTCSNGNSGSCTMTSTLNAGLEY